MRKNKKYFFKKSVVIYTKRFIYYAYSWWKKGLGTPLKAIHFFKYRLLFLHVFPNFLLVHSAKCFRGSRGS